MHAYIHKYIHIHTHIHTYIYIKVYIRMFIHLYVLACKLTSIHMYIQAYTRTYKHGCIYTSMYAYVIYTSDLYEHPIQSLQTESSTFQRTFTANPVPLHSTWHTLLQYHRYTRALAAVSQGCCHMTVGITQHILLARDQVSEEARKLLLLRLCHLSSHYHRKGAARSSIKK